MAMKIRNTSNCLWHNKIGIIEHQEQEFSTHAHKMNILTIFFSKLIATNFNPSWRFQLQPLYPINQTSLSHLDDPFFEKEIVNAIFSMNMSASSGLDGFGLGFFKKNWSLTKPYLSFLFHQFYNLSANIESINRAYMILLPKTHEARCPWSFRPISLQNCPIKTIAKVLTNRLQKNIHNIIDPNPTGFITCRSIAENYVFAADLLNCCHKRKTPTMMLKIYFRKAVDSIC
jgi:hypothetical protein